MCITTVLDSEARRPWWLWLLAVLLTVSAFDLSSSLCLHGADQMYPLPDKPLWVLYLQRALLPFFVPVAFVALRALWRAILTIPIPTAGRVIVMLVACLQLGHVFFRTEHYPFSSVIMFSNYEPPLENVRVRRVRSYVAEKDGHTELINFLREGNPFFARYLGLDYKSGWILGTFSQQNPDTQARVTKLLEENGAIKPRPALLEIDLRTGEFREVSQAGAL